MSYNIPKITDTSRAVNTDLYVYGIAEERMRSLATMVTDIDDFIHDLKGGERFKVEKRKFVGEWETEKVLLNFEVYRVYPHFVMCIGPTGRLCGMTYADVYFGLHNKSILDT